jgi:hypothetical protein
MAAVVVDQMLLLMGHLELLEVVRLALEVVAQAVRQLKDMLAVTLQQVHHIPLAAAAAHLL